jgi:geranylgeranyl reductase family protein
MIEACDVAVIGLGPAGSSAALAAAKGGARVIGLDRKKQPGVPVQCAEFVPMMLGVDSGPVDSAFVQTIMAMESFIDNRHDRHNDDFRGRMIDRAAFDRELAARATGAGADLRFGVQVEEIGADGTIRLNDGTQIKAKVIVGADGPRSRVGAAIGQSNSAIVETRQASVPLLRPSESTDIYLSANIPGGYAWVFPKGNVANVGLGVDRRWKDRLKPELDSLLDWLTEQGQVGREVFRYTGGAIPVGGPVASTGALGEALVLLAGDAAGLTNPVTGAGIPAACHSGRMAGEAAAAHVAGDTDASEDYAEELDELFGASLARAVMRRQQLVDCYAIDRPDDDNLRQGWIAYPAYWARENSDHGERRDELLEA